MESQMSEKPKSSTKPTYPSCTQYPCTECAGDAYIGYIGKRIGDWGGKVKPGERLCSRCFRKRGGVLIF